MTTTEQNVIEIKLDTATLPEDNQIIDFYRKDEWKQGTYDAIEQLFYVSPAEFYFAWDVYIWKACLDEYDNEIFDGVDLVSPCCSAEILGESRICSQCKEHV